MGVHLTKLSSLILLTLFAASARAEQTLNLSQLREEVLSENLDIKIQYEKYYQSQKNVRNNLGEFLPNLSPQLLFWNTTYGVLYAVSPNPSSWFQYRGSNEMALAERHTGEAIKLNILRDLTLSYISVKHQEKVLESLERQEPALEEAWREAVKKEELGVGDPGQIFLRKRKLMRHRQTILALESAIAVQKEGLMTALNRNPSDEVSLGRLPEDSAHMLPPNVDRAVEEGLANSPELAANTFMAEGAKYMSAAAKWSFISFSGIGFDYPSKLAIERSKAKSIALKREKIKNKISNQIALSYEKLDLVERRIELQKAIAASASESLDRALELHNGAQIPYDDVLKAEEALFGEQRALIKLRMERRLLIAKTKRLLGLDASRSRQETRLAEAEMKVRTSRDLLGRTKVSVNLEMPRSMKEKVVSVVYGGDVFDFRITNTTGNFGLYTRTGGRGEILVSADILLEDGTKFQLVKTIAI